MYLHLKDFDLYYDQNGQGEPLIYVHGGFASLAAYLTPADAYAWTWENAFTSHFDFIEYERRGCYRSGCPVDGYDLPTQAADLQALLDHLGLERVHLIGSSAGGPISVLFAATRPERVRSLTLTGTGLYLFPEDDPVTQTVKALLDVLAREGPAAAFAARPPGVETHFGVLWELAEMQERGEVESYLARQADKAQRAVAVPLEIRQRYYTSELLNMGAYIGFDLRSYAAEVQAPTLVLHGVNDREVPLAWGQALAQAVPGSRLVELPGSHSLIIRSTMARQAVIEFILSTPPAPPQP